MLGANPGEAPSSTDLHSVITVEDDLGRIEAGLVSERGYLDEQWKSSTPGSALIQNRAPQLLALLAGGSVVDGTLGQRSGVHPADLALQFWPFHEAVIRHTGCSVILTHAIDIARCLARGIGLGDGEARPSGRGGMLRHCYGWQLPDGPRDCWQCRTCGATSPTGRARRR